jgi:hypothetical protein
MKAMLQQLKTQANRTLTENAAETHITTGSDCLDLFAAIGALRDATVEEIQLRFQRAWAENPTLALKILFFARDIRGGLGERYVFRTILRQLAMDMPSSLFKNIWAIPEFGRYDDILVLLGNPNSKQMAIGFIKTQLDADVMALAEDGTVSLLGKWLPSVNAHNAETVRHGKILARGLGMTDAVYRRTLSTLRAKIAIIENNLREKDYTFDYEKQPSKAMMKYRKAFLRNDADRYKGFLERVSKGEAKLKTGTLFPYDIIRPILASGYGWADDYRDSKPTMTADERQAMDVTWNAQENFTRGENALVVIDGSASMYTYGSPIPANIALSLGIYFAERNRGAFADHFITFSETPRLVQIKGNDIYEKVIYCMGYNEPANTNIKAVFDLILHTAIKNNLPQDELPSTIYIITDMEFDYCTNDAEVTNFEYAKETFAANGYNLPNVVFWNVQSRNKQQPVTMNEQGAVLVSGASPRLFAMIKSGIFSPMVFMMETLNNERYAKIQA